jgi:uncharacterized protein YcfL
MNNFKKFIAVIVGSMLLVGCTTSVATEPITYVTDGIDLKDITSEHSDVDNVDSVKLYETDGAAVEIWEFSSDDAAGVWSDDLQETLESNASSKASINVSGVVNGKYTIDGKSYRLLRNGSTGVYAYGESSKVDSALDLMEIDY